MEKLEHSLKFFNPTVSNRGTARLAVHKNGNWGFSAKAIRDLGLTEGMGAKIGQDEGCQLYLVIVNDFDEDTFKIYKTGKYFYIKAKSVLEELEIDYTKEKVSFLIEHKACEYYYLYLKDEDIY